MATEYRKGDRVQLHPATEHWMRGDRYGAIVKVMPALSPLQSDFYRIKLDKSGSIINLSAGNIFGLAEKRERRQ